MTLRAATRRRSHALRGRWNGLRRASQHGRLDLRDLPDGSRRLAQIALITIAGSAATIGMHALGFGLPGPTILIPAQFLATTRVAEVPVLALLIACVGICVATAGLGYANERSGQRLSRLALVAVGLLGLGLSSQLVGAGHDLAGMELLATPGSVPSPSASQVIVVGGWTGIACALFAVGLALAPRRFVTPWGIALAATAPFLLTAVLVMADVYESFDLGPSAQGLGLPPVLGASSYVAPALAVIAGIVAFWSFPLGLWQVVTWARASRREVGGRLAARAGRWPWLLAALLTLKLGWLLLGYAGGLPMSLGGGAPIWGTVLSDGIVAWTIAAAFAAVAGWWLASGRRPRISERGFTPAAILIVVGFSVVTVVMSLALIALPIAGLLPGTPRTQPLTLACAASWGSAAIGNAAECLIDAATEHQTELTILIQLGTLVAALAAVAWLWREPRWRSTVIFLLAVVAWVAPRVPDAVGGLLGQAAAPSVAPELATFDTALTVAIAVLALGWYTGRQRSAPPAALVLVLVVSTLLVHAGTVVPTGARAILFFLALLFPIAYELLFDSEGLNRRHANRPAKVIEALGIRVGVLSVVALGIALGTLQPNEARPAELGRALFAVPFAALLVAATLSRRANPVDPPVAVAIGARTNAARQSGAQPVKPRTVVVGVVGAVLALSAMVGIGAVADTALADMVGTASASASPGPPSAPPVSPSPPPSAPPTRRLAEFAARTSSAHGLVQDQLTRLSADLTSAPSHLPADGAAIRRLASDERDWLTIHPPADCFATLAAQWDLAMVRLDVLGARIATATDLNDSTTQAAIAGASNDFIDADGAFLDSFAAAPAACGIALPTPSPTV